MMRRNHRFLVLLFQVLILAHSAMAAQSDEIRGLWVDAFHPGFKSAAEVRQLIQDAHAAHFNALFVEVRKRGDAYYQSHIEPQADDIPPGFDPLEEIINQAHSGLPQLQIHAWLVMYPAWNSAKSKPTQANHPFLKHPDWLTRDIKGRESNDGTYCFDPGHPGVQRHLFNVAMDLVSHYDLDGLHLDHIRYPGNEWGYNPLAVKRFNRQNARTGLPATNDLQWLEFRRNQITSLVRKIYLSSIAIKPKLILSAATFTGLPSIENSQQWSQSQAYSTVLQDWQAWMEEGILDLNIPMSYFRQETNANDMARWQNFIVNHRYGRHAAMGLGLFLNSISNNLVQIQEVQRPDSLGNRPDGFVCYSYAAATTNLGLKGIPKMIMDPIAAGDTGPAAWPETEVSIPAMSWKEVPPYGHLKGFVVDGHSHSSIELTRITVTGPVRKAIQSDGTGFFGAANLPPGEYWVKATAWNRNPVESLVAITAGNVSTLNLILSAKSPWKPEQPSLPQRANPKPTSIVR